MGALTPRIVLIVLTLSLRPMARTPTLDSQRPGLRPARLEVSAPRVTSLPLPAVPGAFAIWGATGEDSRGHIWFGVTLEGVDIPSAHLFEYVPQSNQFFDRGNVVDELKRLGIWRPGEHQAKIHSKIIEGTDGYLYFASMDEEGERDDGSRLPTWGGHLWRLKPEADGWEHLLATPEALIGVAGGNGFIYALGYFGHVLYRYDVRTRSIKHVTVGSIDGHISRNLLCDYRGHVYVPRLLSDLPAADGKRVVHVSLVEFSSELEELKETPIEADRYLGREGPTESHGIIGLQEMADRSIFFTTHVGFLYHVVPPARTLGQPISQVPADVVAVGWFHPDGPRYVASLFTNGGTRLYGVAAGGSGEHRYEWVSCDIPGRQCGVAPLDLPPSDPRALNSALLYGSSTQDTTGGHYVVGNIWNGGHFEPIVLRIQPSTKSSER